MSIKLNVRVIHYTKVIIFNKLLEGAWCEDSRSYNTCYFIITIIITELLGEPIRSKDITPVKKAKLFFRSCMDVGKHNDCASKSALEPL